MRKNHVLEAQMQRKMNDSNSVVRKDIFGLFFIQGNIWTVEPLTVLNLLMKEIKKRLNSDRLEMSAFI